MKLFFTYLAILFPLLSNFQIVKWNDTKNWKIYNINDSNIFKYSVDTIQTFSFSKLNKDTINSYLKGAYELPINDPPIWMSAHIASYELNGKTHKIEISMYGGFFYDETTQTYFQLQKEKILNWTSFIRSYFMNIH